MTERTVQYVNHPHADGFLPKMKIKTIYIFTDREIGL